LIAFNSSARIDFQSGFSLSSTDSRFHSANNVQPGRAPIVEVIPIRRNLRLHHHGRKDVGGIAHHHAVKARPGHADDRERVAVHQNALIHDLRIRTETPLPVTEAQDRDGIRFLHLIVRRHKETASNPLNTEFWSRRSRYMG
jgi:hypothetical protein